MDLKGKLKGKMDTLESVEEKKNAVSGADRELKDEELDAIVGGRAVTYIKKNKQQM